MNKNIDYIIKETKKGFNEFVKGTKKMFKEFFNKETNKKQRANMWTFIRLIIPLFTILGSVCALSLGSTPLLFATALLTGFGAVTDYFDGKSSRKHNSASEYGRLLDQVSDKVFAGIIGINLLFINPMYAMILLGELAIAGVNIGYKIKENDLNIKSTLMGKIKEWPLFAALALGFLSPINQAFNILATISIILTTAFQTATVASYVESNENEIKNIKRKRIANFAESFSKELEEKEQEKIKELISDNTNSKLEEYKNLRDILNQIIKQKNNIEEVKTEGIQKTKTL